MGKKVLATILCVAMAATLLVGCGGGAKKGGKKVGVAMPTQSSERWINDGANMKKQLEELG